MGTSPRNGDVQREPEAAAALNRKRAAETQVTRIEIG